MKLNSGISTSLLIIIIAVFILAGSIATGVFIFDESEEKIPTEQLIKESLFTDERARGVNPENVITKKHVGQFARGTLTDLNDGLTKDFYAIQIGDLWRIVDVVSLDEIVSCERFTRIGFPADFIADCQLSFPDAVTVAEIDATLDKVLLSEAPLQVIGLVQEINISEDGESVDIKISSGGEDATVHSNLSDVGNLEIGDTVVITARVIEEPNQTDNDGGNINSGRSIVVISVTEIGGEDDEIISSKNSISPLKETNNATSTQKGSGDDKEDNGKILRINAPNTAPPKDFFLNVFDVDTSFEDISIEGSF